MLTVNWHLQHSQWWGWNLRSYSMCTNRSYSLRCHLSEDIDNQGLHTTDLAKAKILDQETALRWCMGVWYESLALYVPGVEMPRQEDASRVKKDADDPVSKWCLYLPSNIVSSMECNNSLHDYEWQMCAAAANDSLEGIWTNLQLYAYLKSTRHQGIIGVAANTKSQMAIKNCMSQIDSYTRCYNRAHRAMAALAPLLKKPDS